MTQKPLNTESLSLQEKLAIDRTRKASERTLMAWIRTSLSMISFGFSIDAFFRAYSKVRLGTEADTPTEPTVLGLVLVGLGTFVLILGTIEHYLFLKDTGEKLHFFGKGSHWTYMLFISLMVIMIGVTIFIYLIIKSL